LWVIVVELSNKVGHCRPSFSGCHDAVAQEPVPLVARPHEERTGTSTARRAVLVHGKLLSICALANPATVSAVVLPVAVTRSVVDIPVVTPAVVNTYAHD